MIRRHQRADQSGDDNADEQCNADIAWEKDETVRESTPDDIALPTTTAATLRAWLALHGRTCIAVVRLPKKHHEQPTEQSRRQCGDGPINGERHAEQRIGDGDAVDAGLGR